MNVRAKRKIIVKGILPRLANYLDADELRIFTIFDYSSRKPVVKNRKGGSDDTKTTNQSKTIQPSSQSI